MLGVGGEDRWTGEGLARYQAWRACQGEVLLSCDRAMIRTLWMGLGEVT